jgi:hypothetical protein
LEDAEKQMIEAFRLAAIIYISNLRARFGIDVSSQTLLYSQKLSVILQGYDSKAPTQAEHNLRLWCQTVGATSRCLPDAERTLFIRQCSEALVEDFDTTMDSFLGQMKQFAWDEEILDIESGRAVDLLQHFFA